MLDSPFEGGCPLGRGMLSVFGLVGLVCKKNITRQFHKRSLQNDLK